MTQTANKQKNAPQKQTRPGQRQQERLMRLERRRRRRQIWTSAIVAVVVIGLAGVGFWQYERIIAQQPTKTAAHATAIPATPTPSAGPATPPPLTGTSITPTTLTGGLEYVDIKVGTGTAAQTGSTVSVEYTGWLASNGKKFDSSYDHGGQPFTLTLGQHQVIPGWEEGLVGMKPGGTRRMLIPPALAYGSAGSGSTIPPNATLIFDVTVISVQ
ncbi:MAG TPA: FKBP-type peptidyl-prolyl cis-trans isomerase [Ktedonobacteraceae bacterium]|nr:FKBP-type peptidyl-prolyl cis-trans isomerase [Ktedonobacteraceae bacterium]